MVNYDEGGWEGRTDISRDRRDNSFVDDFSIDLVETIRVGGDDSQVQEEMGESKMAAGFVEEKAMSRLDVEENELLPVLVAPEERSPASADPSNTYLQVGNWIAQWDAQYSAWYYYNTETRISTWDKPDDLKGLDFKDPLPDKDPILDEIFSDNSIREERDKGTSHFPPLNGASTNHHHAHSAAANQHSHSAHAHETPNAATSSVDTYGSPQAGAIDEYGSPQAAPVSNYSPPSYNVPSYNAPSYNAPSYNAPSYNAPSYNPPSYNAPSYNCKGQEYRAAD
ncbi:uncharacterized protein LOC111702835 [Eurytemora carolleeae]|uniref:uncharacterized protein LOC111702835 n=1 Tax=Eurytemora carolleeae TaxID=1294199 RepID=UPI000C762339|nr:uncharacterized protein LOC111702835 [Eurytemora carolleeae]|eukprot:XP_023330384.1 uncharacterized protein LOC111702835 [Eurytemora affinis]